MYRACLCCVLLLASPFAKADLTYDLVSSPTDQEGWTLSGWITTDGTIGDIIASGGPSDVPAIKSWSWTVARGNEVISMSSADPGATLLLHGTLIATPTQLILPFPTPDLWSPWHSEELWIYGGPWTELSLLRWVRVNNNPPPPQSQYGPLGYWADYRVSHGGDFMWDTSSPSMGENQPWVIAQVQSVPEPLPVVRLGFSCALLCGYAWRRRKR